MLASGRRIAVGRLPGEERKRQGERCGVLARAARYLEHDASGRQRATQHGDDRLAVAQGGRRMPPRVAIGDRHAAQPIGRRRPRQGRRRSAPLRSPAAAEIARCRPSNVVGQILISGGVEADLPA